MSWNPLRRLIHGNEQAAGTESHGHGSPASDKRRERQEAQFQAKRELSGDRSSPGASGGFYHGGPGGFHI